MAKCSHTVVEQFEAVSWCSRCGSVRVHDQWRLSEHEERKVREAEACPICEFGDPLPVELKEDRQIWRWSCGHWIDSQTARQLGAQGGGK
jgi:hypothetical protein